MRAAYQIFQVSWENVSDIHTAQKRKMTYLCAKTLLRRLSPDEVVPMLDEVKVGSSSLLP